MHFSLFCYLFPPLSDSPYLTRLPKKYQINIERLLSFDNITYLCILNHIYIINKVYQV